MKIAILGWGSLIWDQGELKIVDNKWYEDGPLLPIEYARISTGGRLTLVIKPGWQNVTCLYAISEFKDLEEARTNLMEREGSPLHRIGYYNFLTDQVQIRQLNKPVIQNLMAWKGQRDIDAVIWTDLPPNFRDSRNLEFNLKNIGVILESLTRDEFVSAKKYIESTPEQVKTTLRSAIQQTVQLLEENKLN